MRGWGALHQVLPSVPPRTQKTCASRAGLGRRPFPSAAEPTEAGASWPEEEGAGRRSGCGAGAGGGSPPPPPQAPKPSAWETTPMQAPKTFPHTTSQPRCSRMTCSRRALTISGVSSSSFSVISRSTSHRIVSKDTRAAGSKSPAQARTRSPLRATTTGRMCGTSCLTPPKSGPMRRSSSPSGAAATRSSSAARDASKAGRSSARRTWVARSAAASSCAPRSRKYLSRYAWSKNVPMMASLMVSRISLNWRGMTPEPYMKGMRSKSILMASQFVKPPAYPKSPKERTYFASPHPGKMRRSSTPAHMMQKVTRLLKSPLLEYFRHPFLFFKLSSRSSSKGVFFPSSSLEGFCSSLFSELSSTSLLDSP
mmetsp:Transcript_33071/g.53497  ORF Transcript_33071/g.53497 Transcript_33071/m.53497 type:complete len:367 (+) Transcript_33071:99-1199(+)